jgi:hypothetical protein
VVQTTKTSGQLKIAREFIVTLVALATMKSAKISL